MNKTIRYAATTMSALVLASGAAIPVMAEGNTANTHVYAYAVNASEGCELDTAALQQLLEKYGCNLPEWIAPPATDENPDADSTPDTDAPSLPDTGDSAPDNTPDIPNDTVSDAEKRVVELVNEIRVAKGLSALTLNSELSAVARLKSQDMKDNQYFSHTSPTYGSPFDMMKRFGIAYRTAGENIAMGYQTPEAVVDGWMNSDGHRANILNASFTQIGVGYVADGHYWTQMFIG